MRLRFLGTRGEIEARTRQIVRRRDGRAIGHASIRSQLEWCASAGVRRDVFTHCGSEIVKGDARAVAAAVRALGWEHGIEARIAHDGLELSVAGARLAQSRRGMDTRDG